MANAWKQWAVVGLVGALCVCTPPTARPEGAVAEQGQTPQDAFVAVVDGKVITAQELLEHVRGDMLRLETQIYEVKRQGVQELVAAYLTMQEAKVRGISEAQLMQQEVNAKVEEVTATEVEDWYMANRPRLRKPLEKIRGQIVESLQQQKLNDARRAYVEKLREKAQIKVYLQPPIVDVRAEGAPMKGAKETPITIVEFADFQCPYCKQVLPVLAKVMERYAGQVTLAFRDFPLHGHPAAPKAAEAAHCAEEQGKFWEYHDLLFDKQDALPTADFIAYAAALGLEGKAFQECLESGKYKAKVEQNLANGIKAGVAGTPAFFINGHLLSGAQPLEAFSAVIDDALAQRGPQAQR